MLHRFIHKVGKRRNREQTLSVGLWLAMARLWIRLAQSHSSHVWPGCKDNRDTGCEPVAQMTVSVPPVY